MLYTSSDYKREYKLPASKNKNTYRSEFRRDYSRLIHCPSFRRLKGKTQLFPGRESDFFRNRLTHSLEVAQIAKSIAIRLNSIINNKQYQIDTDLIEFSGLAHDLGHPPFGHLGEEALDEKMMNVGGFEGNAQTLRILSKLEKKELSILNTKGSISSSGNDQRVGLNLTYRSLASILKYDFEIPIDEDDRKEAIKNGKIKKLSPVKGYYKSERDLVLKIKKSLMSSSTTKEFKTIECKIMDVADDIAYSTYDLEDSFKAGFIEPIDIVVDKGNIFKDIARELSVDFNQIFIESDVQEIFIGCFKDLFNTIKIDGTVKMDDDNFQEMSFLSIENAKDISSKIASNGYYRSSFTSELVDKYINAVEIDNLDSKNPCLSTLKIDRDLHMELSALKYYTYYSQIRSPKLSIVEYRGKKIVKEIFEILYEEENFKIMPNDFYSIYDSCKTKEDRKRCVCDFIAGMTDQYAIEFYGRLKSEKPESIFKPF